MPTTIEHPFYPIIYVRGFAGTSDEVEDTVADPYMGFNLGATKIRQVWTGKIERQVFESPVVRLMKDFDYRDVYSDGDTLSRSVDVGPRSIIIHRYYDQVSASLGAGERMPIEDFGDGLSTLILDVRDRICGDDAALRAKFRVYLVAHSMGGLVVRCFLQNPQHGSDEARKLVDKIFTFATPHNGIDLELVGNVPSFLTGNNADTFNRKRMIGYLNLPAGATEANSLNGTFDPDRFFCLVGTNAKDYTVAGGWSARAVGPYSDGLVRINNAFVTGPSGDPDRPVKLAPRAYVYRSHSGPYGIVNSEEGYNNLTRFLFGDVRVDAVLQVKDITLPAELEKLRKEGTEVRASYHFESVARVRGARWDLSRRVVAENSAVFRTYGELFPSEIGKAGIAERPNHDNPELFTTFLRTRARVDQQRPSLGFSVDLGVLVPDYEVDGKLWLKDHFEGGYIFRKKVNLEATPPQQEGDPWQLLYGFDDESPNKASTVAKTAAGPDLQFLIPIVQETRPGIDATLVLTVTGWNGGA